MVHETPQRFKDRVPPYPRVQGIYHVNHVVGDAAFPSFWLKELREINADLGRRNQVDVTIVATKEKDPTYAYAVEAERGIYEVRRQREWTPEGWRRVTD